jgi:hypothetical protein
MPTDVKQLVQFTGTSEPLRAAYGPAALFALDDEGGLWVLRSAWEFLLASPEVALDVKKLVQIVEASEPLRAKYGPAVLFALDDEGGLWMLKGGAWVFALASPEVETP